MSCCASKVDPYGDRMERLYKLMSKEQVDFLFLKVDGDLEYLTGIRRQRLSATDVDQPGDYWFGALIENGAGVTVVSPSMVSGYVKAQVAGKPYIKDVIFLPEHEDALPVLKSKIPQSKRKAKRIGVSKRLWAVTMLGLAEIFAEARFSDAGPMVNTLRRVKDAGEIKLMEHAGKIADEVFYEVVKNLRVGVTEIEVARDIDYLMQAKGAEGTSFVTGVTFEGTGKRDRAEIGRAENVYLEPGMHIAFDFGCVYEGYCSDFGRTVYCGRPDAKRTEIHKLVMGAQAAGIAAMVSEKARASEIDRVVRSKIDAAGYGEWFWHRLGHGIGRDVHEAPFLTSSDDTVLAAGMCFTVEPGIFIPGLSSVRVEDVVMVTPLGGVPLSNATKEIVVI